MSEGRLTHPHHSRRISVDSGHARIDELDVLRGFALCGILVVNIYQQVVFGGPGGQTGPAAMPPVVQLLFYERFLPIFATLFGVGFGIFLSRAATRSERPRLVLARRLLVLFAIGAVHFVFHPGEVLTAYAALGLVVLLPLSLLRGRAALIVAIVLLFLGSQFILGYGPIPGLLALGYALAVLGAPEALSARTGRIATGFGVFGCLAGLYAYLELTGADLPYVNVIGGPGGGVNLLPVAAAIATAFAYCCGLLLLLRTPAGTVISAVFAPMGRMALTNYLTQTVLFLLLSPLVGIESGEDWAQLIVLTVAILALQAVWSTLWLRSFRYGPAEWLWRCLTWWQRAPMRR
ncbi:MULTISPECIES: DUF418 domain-containing protein [Prauserella salsuginis group]|uniref:DUF418 domain-containing protein n=1 Tax=Prauserella salsuginis TaxID=387889 RepID=A0ABW6G0G7_9PSEU|nr:MULTISPECIES: DUF418 domain-containing protein [Prauserella salsuginis group]MCR3721289.1 putative membrane protein YeiB [Prauserella flava]MCR3734631.1 putative membrane protein YeiB [Prauserella salsuginis]